MKAPLKPKSPSTIAKELKRVEKILRDEFLDDHERGEMYGAQQALAWVRGENAAAPSRLIADREHNNKAMAWGHE